MLLFSIAGCPVRAYDMLHDSMALGVVLLVWFDVPR